MFKIASFPILIANKIFHVTVLLLVYFCDHFVAPETCHSRRHSIVCQQTSMVFSDEDKILIKTHKCTQHTQLHVYEFAGFLSLFDSAKPVDAR